MDKFAQERGLLNKLKESFNIKGLRMESKDPQFKSLMIKLRQADDSYRSIILGRSLITNEFGTLLEPAKLINISLKEIIKNIKKDFKEKNLNNFNKNLNQFNDQVTNAGNCLEIFSRETSSLQKSLLIQSYLLDQKLFKKAIFETERQLKFKDLVEKFPKTIGKMQSQMILMINKSEKLFNFMVNSAKKMALFRAGRDVEKYVYECKQIISQIKSYNNSYNKFYSENFENLFKEEYIDDQSYSTSPPPPISSIDDYKNQIDLSSPVLPELSTSSKQLVVEQDNLEKLRRKILEEILSKKSEIINVLKNELLIEDDLLKIINPIVSSSLSGAISQINQDINNINLKLKNSNTNQIDSKLLAGILEEKINTIVVPGLQQFITQQLSSKIDSNQISNIKDYIIKNIEKIIEDKIKGVSSVPLPELKLTPQEKIVPSSIDLTPTISDDVQVSDVSLPSEPIDVPEPQQTLTNIDKDFIIKELEKISHIVLTIPQKEAALGIINNNFDSLEQFYQCMQSNIFNEEISEKPDDTRRFMTRLTQAIKKYKNSISVEPLIAPQIIQKKTIKQKSTPTPAPAPSEELESKQTIKINKKYSQEEILKIKKIIKKLDNLQPNDVNTLISELDGEDIFKEIIEDDDLYIKIKEELSKEMIKLLDDSYINLPQQINFIKKINTSLKTILQKNEK